MDAFNRPRYLERIRDKCVEANDEWPGAGGFLRPARLADILLAIEARFGTDHEMKFQMMSAMLRWNLRADDIEQQDNETIRYLYEILK
jgi:hypothetical protein